MENFKLDQPERFDMIQPPVRTKWYLRPLVWLLSFPAVVLQPTKIQKIDMDHLKPPYLLLCNHNAFHDFKVATVATFPHRANYVVAIDGFIKREKLLRAVGCICKRKFTNDIVLVKHLLKVIRNGDIAVFYPEARYSLCGTTAVIPESLSKLIKLLKVPVVTLICNGNHIDSPFWNLKKRKVPTTAKIKQLLTVDQIQNMDLKQIHGTVVDAFFYDDFRWQKENRVQVTYPARAEGLHKVLYQCPVCRTEYHMQTSGNKLWCAHCNATWFMDEFGGLSAIDNVTPTVFPHIPDWYEWQRLNVRESVRKGEYYFASEVNVKSLPNAKGFLDLGTGYLQHDSSGFTLRYQDASGNHEIHIAARSLYSCHIEYEYLGKYGDCVDLNTLTDTFYLYPSVPLFSVTKIALATEELYEYYKNNPITAFKKDA